MEYSKDFILIFILLSSLVYSVALFLAAKGQKVKDKSYATSLKTSLAHAGTFLIISFIPFGRFFSYLILIYFIKHFYKESIGGAVKLWLLSLLNLLLIFIILFIVVTIFEAIFGTSFGLLEQTQ
jgi:hypothetical protein